MAWVTVYAILTLTLYCVAVGILGLLSFIGCMLVLDNIVASMAKKDDTKNVHSMWTLLRKKAMSVLHKGSVKSPKGGSKA